ncbi:MAG: ribose 5-phosphate isomerase B [Veillonellaceae bacterium]|nr:ribose 5-phosphate isomerase B [Veillonellaceae bacterium]
MKLVIGSDHGGFHLKETILAHLREQGHEVHDCGTHSTDSCDYPLIATAAADEIRSGRAELGILICGTGIGIGIAANKIPGIRAALCHDVFSARASRQHNDANVLTLGERVIGAGLALTIVDEFLAGEFEGGRHSRRVGQLRDLEGVYHE